jgi:hypothetical protein
MRRLVLLPVALLACVAVASAAHAGQANIDSDGNVLMLDASFSPLAASAGSPRPVSLEIHTLFGNIYGNPTPSQAADLTFIMPKGAKYNGASFAACPLPTTDEQLGDTTRCPAKSQVGTGTVTVDARKTSPTLNRLEGTVKVFNGAAHKGKRTNMLLVDIPVGGTSIKAEIDFDVVGNKFVEFDYANRPRGQATFDITRVDLKIGKTIKVKGKTVSLLAYNPTCPVHGFSLQSVRDFSLQAVRDSGTQTATDTPPCVKALH